jgi:hypothetical protein
MCLVYSIGCEGGGGEEEDCSNKAAELRNILNAGWVPNEIETETISVNGDEKEVDIKWRVWQFSDVFTGFNNKRIYSKNTAVLTKNTNNTCSLVPATGYYFKDLIHGPLTLARSK